MKNSNLRSNGQGTRLGFALIMLFVVICGGILLVRNKPISPVPQESEPKAAQVAAGKDVRVKQTNSAAPKHQGLQLDFVLDTSSSVEVPVSKGPDAVN